MNKEPIDPLKIWHKEPNFKNSWDEKGDMHFPDDYPGVTMTIGECEMIWVPPKIYLDPIKLPHGLEYGFGALAAGNPQLYFLPEKTPTGPWIEQKSPRGWRNR